MRALKVILPVLIVFAAIAIVAAQFVLKPRAAREPPEKAVPVVDVVRAELSAGARSVISTGTVVAASEASLSSEVTGRVTQVSPNLERGKRVKKGEVLFRVDGRDYRAAVDQAKAQVAQAELALAVENSQAAVAAREWKLLSQKGENDLALRKPHVANARAQLKSAQAAQLRAELALSRTRVVAPFDARVQREGVELGMLAAPGAQLVQLMATDVVHVQVAVPLAAARTLRFVDDGEDASTAKVRYRAEGLQLAYDARVLRLLPEVDRQTRTAQVLLEVKAPFEAEFPLLPGAFVEVALAGSSLAGAIKVPRRALVGAATVFVSKDGHLSERKLEIVWRARDHVWSRTGIAADELVVVTALPYATDGMAVRESRAEPGSAQ